MSFADFLTGSRNDYVGRKVAAFRKDYIRTHAYDGIKIDQHEFEHMTLETRFDAEDSWDFWTGGSGR